MENNRITALVVDDSPLMRKLVADMLNNSAKFKVLDTCPNGQAALAKIAGLNPDVITLDVDMPVMDGYTCLKKIMETGPRPVVMLSGLTQEGAALTIMCLEAGAFDFVSKPLGGFSKDIEQISGELIEKLVEAYHNRHRIALKKNIKQALQKPEAPPASVIGHRDRSFAKFSGTASPMSQCVVGIGISTGGPAALHMLIPSLPPDFPGTLIVQHMPETFTKAFAEHLNSESEVEVKEAEHGDLVKQGRVLIAPGNLHMRVKKDRGFLKAVLSNDEHVSGHRPSVDALFKSLAEEVGPKTIALIMTGMGRDGVSGLGRIKAAGGHAMAQDESSCTVFGMPKAAIREVDAVDVVHLSKISSRLLSIINKKNGEK